MTDRQAWLQSRTQYLTASDVAAVLSLSPWKTPWDVLAEKYPSYVPQQSTPHMQRGLKYERAIFDTWLDTTSYMSSIDERSGALCVNPEYPGLAATPDFILCTEGGIVVEVKCPARKETWKRSRDMYHWQVRAQMLVTGCKKGILIAGLAGDTIQIIDEVHIDEPLDYELVRPWCDEVLKIAKGLNK